MSSPPFPSLPLFFLPSLPPLLPQLFFISFFLYLKTFHSFPQSVHLISLPLLLPFPFPSLPPSTLPINASTFHFISNIPLIPRLYFLSIEFLFNNPFRCYFVPLTFTHLHPPSFTHLSIHTLFLHPPTHPPAHSHPTLPRT